MEYTWQSPIDKIYKIKILKRTIIYSEPIGNQGGLNKPQIFIDFPFLLIFHGIYKKFRFLIIVYKKMKCFKYIC